MYSIMDDFTDMMRDEEDEICTEDKSKEYIRELEEFKKDTNGTYSGVYKEDILKCIRCEQTEEIPWNHVCMEIDVSKLRDTYKGRANEFRIPNFVEELSSIGDKNNSGFGFNEFGRNHLTTIIIPTSVCIINYRTFAFYRKLKNIVIEEGSRLHKLGDEAFAYCTNLESLSLERCKNLKKLPNNLFLESCTTKLIISNEIESISKDTFRESVIKKIIVNSIKYKMEDFMERITNCEMQAFW